MLRPRWIGVQTPVTTPEVAERVWVALMSTPDGKSAGTRMQVGRHRTERFSEDDVRAAVHETDRLSVALDGHRRDRPVHRELLEPHPHLLRESAHAAACRPDEAVLFSGGESSVIARLRSRKIGRPHPLLGLQGDGLRKAYPPGRGRPFAGISGVLRPPGRQLLDEGRAAHERDLRIPVDADQPDQGREADASRGGVRHVASVVPYARVRRVQGEPVRVAERIQGADPAPAGVPCGDEHRGAVQRGLRSR